MYKHVEQPKSHTRILFTDFSFSLQPHILIERLASHFMSPGQILLLLLNFYQRIQQVFVNGHMSTVITSSGPCPLPSALYCIQRKLQDFSGRQSPYQVL